MSATDTIREGLEKGLADAPSGMKGWWRNRIAALAELEAELARAWAAVKDEAEQTCIEIDLRRATEVELERLTVGRATLEDQTNRAELAEARVAALEQEALRFGGNVWKARAEALEAALYECRQQRDEHYEAGRTLWLAAKNECICGEINARHCPVHNEVLSGGSE